MSVKFNASSIDYISKALKLIDKMKLIFEYPRKFSVITTIYDPQS